MNWGKPSHWRERRAARMAELKRPMTEAHDSTMHVQIDRLVLSGVARHDAGAVVQAMRTELARLAVQPAPAPRAASRIDGRQ